MTHSASGSALRRGYAGVAGGGTPPPLAADEDKREDCRVSEGSGSKCGMDEKVMFGVLNDEVHEYFAGYTNIHQVTSHSFPFSLFLLTTVIIG